MNAMSNRLILKTKDRGMSRMFAASTKGSDALRHDAMPTVLERMKFDMKDRPLSVQSKDSMPDG